MKKAIKIFSVIICIAMLFSACGSKKTEPTPQTSDSGTASTSTTPEEKLPPVKLIYYFPDFNPQPLLPEVNKEINKYLTEKINATVEMNLVNYGDYEQKMTLLLAAGDNVDIFTTGGFSQIIDSMANKGWVLDSGALFEKYAPKSYEALANVWDMVKVNGKIYSMPNEMGWAQEEGFNVKKALAEKIGYDVTNKTIKYEDFEKYLAKIKEVDPSVIPLVTDRLGLVRGPEYNLGYWKLADYAGVKIDDPSFKIVSWFESPEFKSRLDLLHSWFGKGYINKDAATVKDKNSLLTKSFAIRNNTLINSGQENIEANQQAWGGPFVMTAVTPTYFNYSTPKWLGVSIAKASKNPERAAMFLELSHSDPDFIHLMLNGIKDVNYTSDDGVFYKPIKEKAYSMQDWLNVNCHLKLLSIGQSVEGNNYEIQSIKTAKKPGFSGYNSNPELYKTELANVTAAMDEYLPALTTGTVDPSVVLPKFIAKLKTAGIDKIISEMQKEMDAWKTATGK